MAVPFHPFRPLGLTGAEAPPAVPPLAFHVMLKPRGAVCNLDCAYCFYLRKQQLFAADAPFRMSDETLEAFTQQYIAAHRAPEVTFAWQGGEPTLMGIDFYRRAVELQKKHSKPGVRVSNSFQTNGILLDDAWCAFFKENGFLIGLSMDGTQELHDAHRVDRGGHGTFDRVHRALGLLKQYQVDYNVLCVANRRNAEKPQEVYRFFRGEGVEFMQFIPAVERTADGGLTPWSVTAEGWGHFLCGVFDLWVAEDVGRVFVQHFDATLAAYAGLEPSTCVQARTCGDCLAMEHDGSVFSCDHYVDEGHYLGNVSTAPLADLLMSPFQRRFGTDKRAELPAVCRRCPVLFACNGGCPKDRFTTSEDGEAGLNYLCEGYKRFFTHVAKPMRRMAALLRAGRPASDVMLPEPPTTPRIAVPRSVGRNDPCPCGSGRKYKACCLGR